MGDGMDVDGVKFTDDERNWFTSGGPGADASEGDRKRWLEMCAAALTASEQVGKRQKRG